MKLRTLLLTLGVGLMGAAAAQAAETSGMKMDGMKMEESAKAPVNRTRAWSRSSTPPRVPSRFPMIRCRRSSGRP